MPGGGGYGSGAGMAIGIAAAAAAGAGIGYYVLHNRGKVIGCVTRSGHGGTTLVEGKDGKSYELNDTGSVRLTPGERVALKGKKTKASSGKPALEVHSLVKDYGPCGQ